jgi:RNA polymerase sigma factor (sigma-70 family)
MQVNKLHTDPGLITALQNDDPLAFKTFFELYWKNLYKAAYRRLKDQAEAEDLVQEIFTDIWERRHSIKVISSLENYLLGALKFRLIRRFSRANLHKKAVEHLLLRMTEMEVSVLDVMAASDIEQTLSESINQFPENMRKIFHLKTEDYTIKEIAEALGLAEQTVKNNITESLRRLKLVLAKEHPELKTSFYFLLSLLLNS